MQLGKVGAENSMSTLLGLKLSAESRELGIVKVGTTATGSVTLHQIYKRIPYSRRNLVLFLLGKSDDLIFFTDEIRQFDFFTGKIRQMYLFVTGEIRHHLLST